MTDNNIALSKGGPIVQRIIPGLMRMNEWGLSAAQLLDWIKAVMDMGLTTFDHADLYGGYTVEKNFGEALKLEPSLRDNMQLITKCGILYVTPNRPDITMKHYNTSTDYIIQAAETSLRNFNTDYIDLLLVHRPDPLMHPEEIADAFYELYETDKVRYFGVSNFTPSQFEMLQAKFDLPLVTNQVEFSVTHHAPMYDGTFDQALRHEFIPMAWSSLGGGGIFRADTEQTQRLNTVLKQIGDEVGGKAIDQVALAWLLNHPSGVIPVVGTGKLERLQSAVDALDIELSRVQWFRILEAAAGHEVP